MANYVQFIHEKNASSCLLKQALGHTDNTYKKINIGDTIYISTNILGKRVIFGELKVLKKFITSKLDLFWDEDPNKPYKHRVYGILTKYDIPIEVNDEMKTYTPEGKPLTDAVILRGGYTIPLTSETAALISKLAIENRLKKLEHVEELEEVN